MTDWFLVSAWYENGDDEIHFEITNEDGEQYFFFLSSSLVIEKINYSGKDALDAFRYAEEDMLGLAVTIIDEECLGPEESIKINKLIFAKYFIN